MSNTEQQLNQLEKVFVIGASSYLVPFLRENQNWTISLAQVDNKLSLLAEVEEEAIQIIFKGFLQVDSKASERKVLIRKGTEALKPLLPVATYFKTFLEYYIIYPSEEPSDEVKSMYADSLLYALTAEATLNAKELYEKGYKLDAEVPMGEVVTDNGVNLTKGLELFVTLLEESHIFATSPCLDEYDAPLSEGIASILLGKQEEFLLITE